MTVYAVLINIALPFFTHTNLVNIDINIGILIFLITASLQYLDFTSGVPIRINAVFKFYIYYTTGSTMVIDAIAVCVSDYESI